MAGPTRREVVHVVDVSARLVTLVATQSLTRETHEGKTLLMGASGAALTFTLPAAEGSGARYHFVVSVVNTSNYIVNVANANDTIDGGVVMSQDAADTVVSFTPAAADDTITLNGTTTGGAAIGDWMELQDIALNQWAVKGLLTGSGIEATPFSAAV